MLKLSRRLGYLGRMYDSGKMPLLSLCSAVNGVIRETSEGIPSFDPLECIQCEASWQSLSCDVPDLCASSKCLPKYVPSIHPPAVADQSAMEPIARLSLSARGDWHSLPEVPKIKFVDFADDKTDKTDNNADCRIGGQQKVEAIGINKNWKLQELEEYEGPIGINKNWKQQELVEHDHKDAGDQLRDVTAYYADGRPDNDTDSRTDNRVASSSSIEKKHEKYKFVDKNGVEKELEYRNEALEYNSKFQILFDNGLIDEAGGLDLNVVQFFCRRGHVYGLDLKLQDAYWLVNLRIALDCEAGNDEDLHQCKRMLQDMLKDKTKSQRRRSKRKQ